MATRIEKDANGRPLLEGSSIEYSATLKDKDGQPTPAASLVTLTLTFYSLHGAQAIINSRNGQNVLNANNVTVDSNGLLVWDGQPADAPILDSTLPYEWHRALFSWTTATKAGKHEVDFKIVNVNKVS